MATIKFSKEAAKFMGAGKSWLSSSDYPHRGYGLWDTTASSAIFGGPAGTSTVHSVLNIYKGTVPTVTQFTDLASRESDLLLSFEMYGFSDHVLYLGVINETLSHRYVCGRHLNFKDALRSGEATWFAAVNYEEPSALYRQTSPSATWTVSLSGLTTDKLFNEPITAKIMGTVHPAITGTVSTLLSSTVTGSSAVFEFSTPCTGTVVSSYTATFFGGGFGGQSTVSPLKGTVPADSFLYGTFTNAMNAYEYSGAGQYSHYRRGAMIGTVGLLYSTADMQILTTNIVAGQRYNCAGIFLNFPQVWTI